MKIRYVWYDNPNTEKVYDTDSGYKEHKHMRSFLRMQPMTKEEWDEVEKKRFEERREKGLVLHYEIIDI